MQNYYFRSVLIIIVVLIIIIVLLLFSTLSQWTALCVDHVRSVHLTARQQYHVVLQNRL